MTFTLDLPETTIQWLQSEAEAQGTNPASIVKEQLARARARAEAQAILNGPFHTLDEADRRFREKYGMPHLSHLSDEELARSLEDGLAQIDPEKLAEAERQGLL